jgi:curved DNA-binding protein CbpA
MDGRRARALLGVSEHTTPHEIRRAFRAHALVAHPDHGGTSRGFADLVDAMDTLIAPPDAQADARVRHLSLVPAHPRFDAYDSAPRPRPVRSFDDMLLSAVAARG